MADESCNAYNSQQEKMKKISIRKFPEQSIKKKRFSPMKKKTQTASFSSVSRSCRSRNSNYDSPLQALQNDGVASFPSDDSEQHSKKHSKKSPLHKRSFTEMSSGTDTTSDQTSTPISTDSVDCQNTSTSPEHLELEGRLANADSAGSSPKKQCLYLDDFNYDNRTQYSKDELIRFMCLAKTALARKNRLIKLLKQKKRRQQKKIDALTSLLRYLQNKNCTIPDAA